MTDATFMDILRLAPSAVQAAFCGCGHMASLHECPSCGHRERAAICPDCDCGDPTSVIGPHEAHCRGLGADIEDHEMYAIPPTEPCACTSFQPLQDGPGAL